MILRGLNLRNFGVFQGTVKVDLPLHPNKNIYLIDGNNGYGKSTLFNAILFALYGAETGQERLDYINRTALRDGLP